jgi:hypothetical protein
VPKTITSGILSVLGSQYYQPIADLAERLMEKEYQIPDRVSAGYRESGYAAAIIILSAAVLESFVQRDRYFYAKKYGSLISELPVTMYLKQVNKYPRYHRVDELFEVRNAVAHNHIWHIEFEAPPSGGRRHKESVLVPKTHRLRKMPARQAKIPRTKIVQFNLIPVRLDRLDVQKALSVSIHALQFLSIKGHNPVPLVSNNIVFQGRRIAFADLAVEVSHVLHPRLQGRKGSRNH